MAGFIRITDRRFLEDSRKEDGQILCQGVTGWGMLASPTASDKDFYYQGLSDDKHSVVAQATYHFFVRKVVTADSPVVLLVKLFPDPQYNPTGFPIIANAEMTAGETFAEWRMDAYFGQTGDSQIVLHRVPDDQVWYHHFPPLPQPQSPWRILYNLIKYGWIPYP